MKQIIFEEILDGIAMDRIVRDYEYTMPTKHFHNEYEIYYLLEGERYYFIGQQTYLIKKGSLVLIDRNQIHKTGLAGNSYHDRILIEFKEEPFSTFFASDGRLSIKKFFNNYNGAIALNEDEQKAVEGILFGMISELQEKKTGYEMLVKMNLAKLLIFIMRRQPNSAALFENNTAQTAKHKKVHEVAGYIVAHYTTNESLDDFSKRFFVSKCYLSRIFKEVTGFTINEYIHIHRIQQAQILLSDSEYNITEIADLLGYDSITYFEKVFKKYTETSPLKYRKSSLRFRQEKRMQKEE